MDFKWQISLDTVVQVLAFVGTMAGIAIHLDRRITIIETKLNIMWTWFMEKLSSGSDGYTDKYIDRFFKGDRK